MRKGFLYALSLSMILASQSLTALAEDQAPTGTETPASSQDTGEGASEPSSEITNGAGESEENPTVEAETKNGASDKEAGEETETETVAPDNASAGETKKEESVPEEASVDETPVVPAPAAETESAPMAKAMAPMNAPASQSFFTIGDTGYDTLDKALEAAQSTAGDVTIKLTTDIKIDVDRTLEYVDSDHFFKRWVKVGYTYKIDHKQDNGTITLDLNGHLLQGYFKIILSSPTQMVIKNGTLVGSYAKKEDYWGHSDTYYRTFEVTSPSASVVFQDLKIGGVWGGYLSEKDSTVDYAFQIIQCQNIPRQDARTDDNYLLRTRFDSSEGSIKVLIKNSRLSRYYYTDGNIYGYGINFNEQYRLENSIVTGLGDQAPIGDMPESGPNITESTGGMVDQYSSFTFATSDSNLHYFRVEHPEYWQFRYWSYRPNLKEEACWIPSSTDFIEEKQKYPLKYDMSAIMLAPAKAIGIGVIFEQGHEYQDLDLTWKVATEPTRVTNGFEPFLWGVGTKEDTLPDYSLPTYFEETKQLTANNSYVSYVPEYFYNLQGDNMTVPAGKEVVTWSYTNSSNNNSVETTDTPAFQDLYDLVWNDPKHNEIEGTNQLDYRVKAVRKTYSVQYDANGGTNDPEAQKSLRYYEDSIKAPETKGMARDGYTFTGWYLDADATIEFKNFGTLLDSKIVEKLTQEGALKDGSTTITLYAGWKKNEEKPAQPTQPAETAKPAQPSQNAKASSAPAVNSPRTSNPVSSTGKLFIPRTDVGAEPKSAE